MRRFVRWLLSKALGEDVEAYVNREVDARVTAIVKRQMDETVDKLMQKADAGELPHPIDMLRSSHPSTKLN